MIDRRSKKILVSTILILILSAILLTPISTIQEVVHATFPGKKNGKIVFERSFTDKAGKTQHQIFVMNPDGSGLVQLTYKGWNTYPRWSADGKKIVFSSDRTGTYQIFTMNQDGSDQTRITHDKNDYWEPCWSPDGTKIVCTGPVWSGTDRPIEQLYIMSADGYNLRMLTYGSGSNWSPDGTKIAFHYCCDRLEQYKPGIYVINPDGSGRVPLLLTSDLNLVHCVRPYWSPNGAKIMFFGCLPDGDQCYGRSAIYIMNADGNNPSRLNIPTSSTFDPTGCYFGVCWSPDGKKIAFSHHTWSQTSWVAWIYVMNPDGTGITQLTHGSPDMFDIFDSLPDWQPRAVNAKG